MASKTSDDTTATTTFGLATRWNTSTQFSSWSAWRIAYSTLTLADCSKLSAQKALFTFVHRTEHPVGFKKSIGSRHIAGPLVTLSVISFESPFHVCRVVTRARTPLGDLGTCESFSDFEFNHNIDTLP